MEKNGFVKAELLLFFVILFLIGVAVFFAYIFSATQAADKQRLADVAVMKDALKVYYNENGFYPNGSDTEDPVDMNDYVDRWPKSPPLSGSCTSLNNRYLYSQKLNGSDFTLDFCLGQSTDGVAAGVHTLTTRGIQ